MIQIGNIYYQSCLSKDKSRLKHAKNKYAMKVSDSGVITGIPKNKNLFKTEAIYTSETEPSSHFEKLKKDLLGLKILNRLGINTIRPICYRDAAFTEFLVKKISMTIVLEYIAPKGTNTKGNLRETVDTLPYSGNKDEADIIICMRSLHHASNIRQYIKKIKSWMQNQTTVIFEVPDCKKGLRRGSLLVPFEEHISYFTKESLIFILEQSGLEVIFAKSYIQHLENSLVVCVRKTQNDKGSTNKLSEPQDIIESQKNLMNAYYKEMTNNVSLLQTWAAARRKNGGEICVYGVGHFALNVIGIASLELEIDIYIDDNENKKGMLLPFAKKYIVSSKNINKKANMSIILFVSPVHIKKILERLRNCSYSSIYVYTGTGIPRMIG